METNSEASEIRDDRLNGGGRVRGAVVLEASLRVCDVLSGDGADLHT